MERHCSLDHTTRVLTTNDLFVPQANNDYSPLHKCPNDVGFNILFNASFICTPSSAAYHNQSASEVNASWFNIHPHVHQGRTRFFTTYLWISVECLRRRTLSVGPYGEMRTTSPFYLIPPQMLRGPPAGGGRNNARRTSRKSPAGSGRAYSRRKGSIGCGWRRNEGARTTRDRHREPILRHTHGSSWASQLICICSVP